ncbi:hypothetical protein TNCV_714511 [Trichonephila clavipes]|nr:hypothetical protein TNCV_714511 [Trichonephila clavipes]
MALFSTLCDVLGGMEQRSKSSEISPLRGSPSLGGMMHAQSVEEEQQQQQTGMPEVIRVQVKIGGRHVLTIWLLK